MLPSVDGRVVPDVSKDRGAFIFGIKNVGLLDREGEGSISPNGTASLARRLGYSATLL
jgi:hypothetical protein